MDKWSEKLQERSKLERNLIVSVIVLGLLCFVFFVFLVAIRKGRDVCYSPQCIEASYHILSTIDQSIDPCQDFYKFTCGGFHKTTLATKKRSTLTDLQYHQTAKLNEILLETSNNTQNYSIAFENQKEFYKACLNTTFIEKNNDTGFLESIRQATGSWPLSHGFVEDLYWPEVMVKSKEKGLVHDFFLSVGIKKDERRNKVFLDVALPPKRSFEKKVFKEVNLEGILNIARTWGDPTLSATWELRETIKFARNLSKIIENAYSQTKNLTLTQQKTPISALKNVSFLKLHWLSFLKNITKQNYLKQDDVIVFSTGEEYLKELYYLIQSTSTKLWVNYIVILNIINDYEYLSSKVGEYVREVLNEPQKPKRSEVCYRKAIELFPHVAETEYIKRSLTKEKKNRIEKLIENVKEEIIHSVKDNAWMNLNDQKSSIEFLKNMKQAIGWTVNETQNDNFERLNMSSVSLIEIVHTVRRYYFDRTYDKIGSSGIDDILEDTMASVNAYYVHDLNILILPAPILYPPVYDPSRPQYLNYGSLGHIIGHELTHTFSNNLWNNDTRKKFEENAQCIVKDYEKFVTDIESTQKNGAETLRENLADLLGINLAYTAYQRWTDDHGVETQLPGLSYTPNQLFWIMASTYMCSDNNFDQKDTDSMDIHGVQNYRIAGAVMHSPYFSDDFLCPVDTPMNPGKKCKVYL
ncbi:membrane metallo-endopeptidase-like 1 [Sitophilus oryzae]|uniref:Membrane metallo-endopeptidase-like 1 n=1 Tax=Sitophilus oryzae TaxID=7048 RepID=A0A6J2XQN0_SITOR|nr:membrane metallo-endopeptidase-like 1 [Sitophilus oryzae]